MRVGRYIVPPSHFQYDVVDHRADIETTVHNARELSPSATLDTAGFELRTWPTACANFLDDREVMRTYYAEMRSLVRRALGADQVIVFDHVVRSSSGRSADAEAPVNRVHCDYTAASGPNAIERLAQLGVYSQRHMRLLGALELRQLAERRFAFVNIWRSIADPGIPVQRMPLAVCDARTVSAKDYFYYEVIHPINSGREEVENYSLKFNDKHRWYCYPMMMREECLLFKVYDSKDEHQQSVFHAAFNDPFTPPHASERRSIETRAIAFFDTGCSEGDILQRRVRMKGAKMVFKESPHE